MEQPCTDEIVTNITQHPEGSDTLAMVYAGIAAASNSQYQYEKKQAIAAIAYLPEQFLNETRYIDPDIAEAIMDSALAYLAIQSPTRDDVLAAQTKWLKPCVERNHPEKTAALIEQINLHNSIQLSDAFANRIFTYQQIPGVKHFLYKAIDAAPPAMPSELTDIDPMLENADRIERGEVVTVSTKKVTNNVLVAICVNSGNLETYRLLNQNSSPLWLAKALSKGHGPLAAFIAQEIERIPPGQVERLVEMAISQDLLEVVDAFSQNKNVMDTDNALHAIRPLITDDKYIPQVNLFIPHIKLFRKCNEQTIGLLELALKHAERTQQICEKLLSFGIQPNTKTIHDKKNQPTSLSASPAELQTIIQWQQTHAPQEVRPHIECCAEAISTVNPSANLTRGFLLTLLQCAAPEHIVTIEKALEDNPVLLTEILNWKLAEHPALTFEEVCPVPHQPDDAITL